MNPEVWSAATAVCAKEMSKDERTVVKSLAGRLRATGLEATLVWLENKTGGERFKAALEVESGLRGRQVKSLSIPEQFRAMERATLFCEALHMLARAGGER